MRKIKSFSEFLDSPEILSRPSTEIASSAKLTFYIHGVRNNTGPKSDSMIPYAHVTDLGNRGILSFDSIFKSVVSLC